MLVDIHCHILTGIDDGAKDLNTSIDMCKIAAQDGTERIIATPHFINGENNNNRTRIQQKVVELNNYLKEQNIDINIYPGCEAFICPELPQLVRDGEVCTLNNTKYVLIELPKIYVPDYIFDVIYRLELDGYIPIIAHPERNAVIAKKPDILYDLINRGALTQINATSLTGLFGSGVMKTAVELLKHNMVHLLASDAHTTGERSPKLSGARAVIERKVGSEALTIVKNSEALINDKPLHIEEPIKYETKSKSGFLGGLGKFVSGLMK